MIFSKNQTFSDAQAITATAASTNIIDTGAFGTPLGGNALARDLGKGIPIPFLAQVTVDFATLTSLKFGLQCDSTKDFSSGSIKTVVEQTIVLADLTAGKQVAFQVLPNDITERYVRMYYTVAGTNASAGKVTAGITMGNQTN